MRGLSLSPLCCLLVLSCSKDSPSPTAPPANAAAEEAGPWQTVSINGALYRRVAAKPTETSQADLLITIPIRITTSDDGSFRFADTVVIAGRTYTADCGTPSGQDDTADDVGNTRSSATTLSIVYPTISEEHGFAASPTYEMTRGDTDYFRVNVTQRVELAVGSFGTTDVVGQLFDEDGILLDEADNNRIADNHNFFLYVPLVEPGTYYVKVTGAGGTATGFYGLTVSTWNPPAGKAVVSQSIATAREKSMYSEQLKKIRR